MATELTGITQEMQSQTPMKYKYYFTVEGNIGSGKSTLLEIIKQKIPQIQWIQEPVRQWQKVEDTNENMLQKYYKEPKRWGFTFQTFAMFTRIRKMQEAFLKFEDKIKISQRSILADKFVFSKIMQELNYMDNSQYEVFKSLYKNFEQMINVKNIKVIYLRCPPEKCQERIKRRNRTQEAEIPLDYLEMIHEKHQNWLKNEKQQNYLVIDTSEEIKSEQSKERFVKLVNDFINFS